MDASKVLVSLKAPFFRSITVLIGLGDHGQCDHAKLVSEDTNACSSTTNNNVKIASCISYPRVS